MAGSILDAVMHRFRDSDFLSLAINSLSASPDDTQEVWDAIGTPLLRALERIHRGEALEFDDIYALARSIEIPEGTLLPRLELARDREDELLRIAREQDEDALAQINAELGLGKGIGGVGKRGADLEVLTAPGVGTLKKI